MMRANRTLAFQRGNPNHCLLGLSSTSQPNFPVPKFLILSFREFSRHRTDGTFESNRFTHGRIQGKSFSSKIFQFPSFSLLSIEVISWRNAYQ